MGKTTTAGRAEGSVAGFFAYRGSATFFAIVATKRLMKLHI
jgi:hypothetical protein